jgi:hypothetical protein
LKPLYFTLCGDAETPRAGAALILQTIRDLFCRVTRHHGRSQEPRHAYRAGRVYRVGLMRAHGSYASARRLHVQITSIRPVRRVYMPRKSDVHCTRFLHMCWSTTDHVYMSLDICQAVQPSSRILVDLDHQRCWNGPQIRCLWMNWKFSTTCWRFYSSCARVYVQLGLSQ